MAKVEPRRAGGYIDRGDGKGWVLDTTPPAPPPPPRPHADPVPGPAKVGGWVLAPEPEPKPPKVNGAQAVSGFRQVGDAADKELGKADEPESEPESVEPAEAKPAKKAAQARRK